MKKRVPGLSESALQRFLLRARRQVRLAGTANVLITSSRKLQALNREFRGKNAATDVLSFPAVLPKQTGFAGDIAISADIAAQNARRLGHSAGEEIKILSLHGLLHLAGYDHERDNGEMAAKESALRKTLGLPAGLIERTNRQRSGTRKRANP